MTRTAVAFECQGSQLFGTLDAGTGDAGTGGGTQGSGLLIVTGGREIRSGAHRGMAELADRLSAQGWPVFRFDRRGVGDSEGEDGGFRSSASDIAAALAAFRRVAPQVRHVVGFGNCDAATALVLHQADVDALVLANPWVVEPPAGADPDLPPPVAIRDRYARRLRDPQAWLALLRGRIDLRKLGRGLASLRAPREDAGTSASLAEAFMLGLEQHCVPTTILLATGDATAIAFDAEWAGRDLPGVAIVRVASSSHSFGDEVAAAALFKVLSEQLGT